MVLAADYTNGSKKRAASLTLYAISNGRREQHNERAVSGKAEARKVAASLGYQCWNF